MARVVLFHWHAVEARERAARLRKHGHVVRAAHSGDMVPELGLVKRPPDAFVIDLSRLPSHGAGIANWIRERKATRGVPIVFVGGAPEKVDGVRAKYPDAAYATWRGIKGALKRAMANPPADPVVHRSTGYSQAPLAKKLGIKDGSVVALLGAPKGFESTLGELGPGTKIKRSARGSADVILLFSRDQAGLDRRFGAARRMLGESGGLWLAWPKQSSGMKTDLGGNDIRRKGLDAGLVDNKVCSVDATWSAHRFANRRK